MGKLRTSIQFQASTNPNGLSLCYAHISWCYVCYPVSLEILLKVMNNWIEEDY